MGKQDTLISCLASLGMFALGTTIGSRRARRNIRPSPSPICAPPRPSTCAVPGSVALECPVCLGDLILPRVTTCGHTLCTTCLAALFQHERRPACPVCRKRIRVSLDKLPINFMVQECVEARVAMQGEEALECFHAAEEGARRFVTPFVSGDDVVLERGSLMHSLRPAWNWFKWSVIIVTEFGAFLVSLKEVLESTPSRTRRYQRIV